MPPGVFLAIMHYSSKAQGAVAMFGGLVVFLAVACLRWRHQARSVVKHLDERFITGKCLLGKSKVQGQRRAFEWRVPREIGRCFSLLDRVFVLLSTLYVKNPNPRSLIPDFASDILSPSSVWLPKPMSDGKFMRTLWSFLELIGVTQEGGSGRGLASRHHCITAASSQRLGRGLAQKVEIVGKPAPTTPHPGNTRVTN